jgi:hypothetical protein
MGKWSEMFASVTDAEKSAVRQNSAVQEALGIYTNAARTWLQRKKKGEETRAAEIDVKLARRGLQDTIESAITGDNNDQRTETSLKKAEKIVKELTHPVHREVCAMQENMKAMTLLESGGFSPTT